VADNTLIEWADATVNAVNGCSVLSPGCTNCYAMKLAGTRLKHHPSRAGLTVETKAGPVWNGTVRLNEDALMQPLRWKRPRRIFWNAHGDLFHEAVPDEWIDHVFAVCALTPQHTHMILTKRAERMREYMGSTATRERIARQMLENYKAWGVSALPTLIDALANRAEETDPSIAAMPIRNVWLGVSVEDQTRADERIPDLLATPAAVRFLSCEPLLGPINLTDITIREAAGEEPSGLTTLDALTGLHRDAEDTITGIYGQPDPHIDWVIIGAESGRGARWMRNEWAQALVDQCKPTGVAAFVKQLSGGGPKAIHDIKQFPEGLRVREFPA